MVGVGVESGTSLRMGVFGAVLRREGHSAASGVVFVAGGCGGF